MFRRASCPYLTLIILAGCFIEAEFLTQTEERGLNDVPGGDELLPEIERNEPKMILMTPVKSPQYNDDFLSQGEEIGVAGEVGLFPRMINQEYGERSTSHEIEEDTAYEDCIAAARSDYLRAKYRSVSHDKPWDSVNEISITMHNNLRSKHGAPPLKFDQGLMDIAQAWAAHLACSSTFCHNLSNIAKGIGENAYSVDTGLPLESIPMDEVVKFWYDENKFYTYGWDTADPAVKAKFHKFGHFTQLVWKGSRRVGCATATAESKWIVVCNYHPNGNVPSQFAENVLPVRLYNRMADPMKDSFNRLINRARSKKQDPAKEIFRKMRKQMYDRGDGAMGGQAAFELERSA